VTKKQKPHYVNNKEFSSAVVDYVKSVRAAEAEGNPVPIVTDYIASCFLKIAEGLSHKPNFIRYTYREEMVMDAVENCLKAIMNPNAFAYFTQISYYAFIRRITKEKKQFDVKMKIIEQSAFEEFVHFSEHDAGDFNSSGYFVDELRNRIDKVKETDNFIKEFSKAESEKEKASKLELFMGL
jgi:hypothetical protein